MESDNKTERMHRKPTDNACDRHLRIRNILNIIFMLGAVAGMLTYFYYGHFLGAVIIIVSMIFKVAECCIRFIR